MSNFEDNTDTSTNTESTKYMNIEGKKGCESDCGILIPLANQIERTKMSTMNENDTIRKEMQEIRTEVKSGMVENSVKKKGSGK